MSPTARLARGHASHGVYPNGAVDDSVGGELPSQRNPISGNITGASSRPHSPAPVRSPPSPGAAGPGTRARAPAAGEGGAVQRWAGEWLLCATLLVTVCPLARAEEPDGAALLASQPPGLVATLGVKHVVLEDRSDARQQAMRGFVIFMQPTERVYRLLSQTARQIEYRPELDSIETVEQFPDGTVDEHRMKIMLIRIRYRLRNHSDPATRRIWWELDPGFDNDLRRVSGSWELHALDPHETLGVFATEVELGAGMPSFLEDFVTRKNLPKTLERCRQWVDRDGRAR